MFTVTVHYSKHEYAIVLGIANRLDFCKTQFFVNKTYPLHVGSGNIKAIAKSNLDN
jgi:hypothetical protein